MIEWKRIPGFSRYEVSSDGRVRRAEGNARGPAGSELTRHPRNAGQQAHRQRPAVTLYDAAGRRAVRNVNRLVAEAFIPNPEGKPLVCHRDGDVRTDTVQNLYWGSHLDNTLDRIRHGHTTGQASPINRKLTEFQVRVARRLRGRVIAREIAKLFGVSASCIDHVWTGRSYSRVAS